MTEPRWLLALDFGGTKLSAALAACKEARFASNPDSCYNNAVARIRAAPFSLPALLIYIILGRYFMRGLLAGALKG